MGRLGVILARLVWRLDRCTGWAVDHVPGAEAEYARLYDARVSRWYRAQEKTGEQL